MNQHEAVVKREYIQMPPAASAWTVGVSLARSSRTLAAYSGASLRPSKIQPAVLPLGAVFPRQHRPTCVFAAQFFQYAIYRGYIGFF